MSLYLGHNFLLFHPGLTFCNVFVLAVVGTVVLLSSSVCPVVNEDKRFVQAS